MFDHSSLEQELGSASPAPCLAKSTGSSKMLLLKAQGALATVQICDLSV